MTDRFRPSQANYWGNCAAFSRFTRDVVETTNDAAREGTCAAWVAEVVLDDQTKQTTCSDLIGQTHENGWVVTTEMAADVQQYIQTVRENITSEIVAEEFVTASTNPLIEGTLDTSASCYFDGVLKIIDLKYGRRIVETTSKQLVCYGYGKLMKAAPGTIKEVHLSIYQPRAFHRDGIYRTRVVTPEQLHAEFLDLWNMAVESQKPDSAATAGSHCADCAAASSCEALAQTTYNLVHYVTSRDRRDMKASELSHELNFIDECKKVVNARFKAIESEAEARLKRETIPGWTVKTGKGNRVFTTSATNIKLLTGIDPTEKSCCSPAELERRGASKELLKSITTQPTTSMKLQRVKPDAIASIFNATKGK